MRSTPYYVIDKNKLDDTLENLKQALNENWPNYIIGYSYKTNALPWVIQYFKNHSCWAEVVSDDEYNLAKYIGVNSSQIIYNGPIKTKETMLEAIRNGCLVNVDAQREIQWLKELEGDKDFSVGIRVNYDIEKWCPNQSACGEEGGRFGFCYENGELRKAIKEIQEIGIKISGIHLHTSSKTRGIDIYKAIAQVACEIINEYELKLEYVDIGGGFFGGLPNKPQYADYLREVVNIFRGTINPQETTLVVEPGMSVIGANISFVTSVIDVKDTNYGRFVVTDGSRTQIDPLMSKSNYFYRVDYQDEAAGVHNKQVICGYTCMENDRIFKMEQGKELSVGDVITYDKVGAYTMCLTPLFIKYFPDVYVKDLDEYTLVREKWGPQNYIQGAIEA